MSHPGTLTDLTCSMNGRKSLTCVADTHESTERCLAPLKHMGLISQTVGWNKDAIFA